MLFTMHGTVMIFFVIIPLLTGTFGNYLIPLMLGAPDMAFPRLNMMGYWFWWPGIVLIIMAFGAEGGGPAAGWTAYPPLSTIEAAAPGSSERTEPVAAGASRSSASSSMMGAVNYVTTIVKMRAPGMTLFRMPLSIWGLLIAALLQLFALPVLTAAAIHAAVRPRLRRGLLHAAGRDHQQHRCPETLGQGGRGAPAPVAAPLLVLQPPRRLHHGPAGHGVRLGHPRVHAGSRSSATSRWPTRWRASRGWGSSSGATTCSCPA